MKFEILQHIINAPRVTFAKETVKRDKHNFHLYLDAYEEHDFEKVIPSLKEHEKKLLSAQANAEGMRWVHSPGTVLFRSERLFDVPFSEFVARVDISRAGEFFRDSLSVTNSVVARDSQNRPTRLGMRFVALPQPNYSSFFGKGNLDVYKLVKIDYHEKEHRFWMLTVHSPNSSAICDDGYLSFREENPGHSTAVTFLSCQDFPPPPLMALAQLHKWAWFKNRVTEDSYRRFSNDMMSNIWKCYNGQNFQVGR